MDWVKVHAVINEAPGVGIGIGTLLFLISALAGGRPLQKAAFSIFAVTGLLAAVAFLSGAPAETVVQGAAGASEKLIHEHHFAARIAVAVTILLGFIGVTAKASMQNGRALSRTLMALSLCASLAAVAATGWAVYSGVRVQNAKIQAQYRPRPNQPKETEQIKKHTPKATRAVPLT